MDLDRFTSYVRRCVDDYHMIDPGDRVAVGVSGGKDSLALLAALRHLRRFHPSGFELEAITIDMGFPDMDFTPVAAFCDTLGVPYSIIKTDIREIVFDVRKEENPCSLCSKMRRGALNDAAIARGCGKLALGHHFDDAVETFLMSLVFEGRIGAFKPVTFMSRAGSPRSGRCSTWARGALKTLWTRWRCRSFRRPARRTGRANGGKSRN